ncbi:F-box domain-containing protein [Mycena chlorophos]|uniref:F-box domain-containing protein n=1 Tax=Mycena chlorophos TaxID=658473 RepID=A0A8H6TIH5_MYCCL|nr:F-box domain-containing protein [Mycena chlorophos]
MWYPGRVRPKKDPVGDGPMDTLFTAMRLTGTSNDLVPDLAMLVYMLRPNPIHTVAFTEMARSRGSTRILLRLSDMRDVSHALSNVQGIEDNEFRRLARANFPLY